MENSIFHRIASGDKNAMRDCVKLYGNLVWSIARKHFQDAALAEDIVQEIFTELWRKAGNYRADKATETTFVSLIARRRCIDQIRKNQRRPKFQPLPETNFNGEPSVEAPSVNRLDRENLTHALGTLSNDVRNVLELYFIKGHSHGDIARDTGLPLGTVKTRIRRGLIELRNCLRKMDTPLFQANT